LRGDPRIVERPWVFTEAAARADVRKIVVVVCSPRMTRSENPRLLENRLRLRLRLRLIDGTARRDFRQARADVSWADVVLICGTSELDHKIPNL